MAEASLAAQALAVVTMRAYAPLTALVPAANIMDRNQRPEVFPCILIGEGQVVSDDVDVVDASEIYLNLHVWVREPDLIGCKSIAGEIRKALRFLVAKRDGYDLSFTFDDANFMRDPGGELSHGIVTMRVQAWELIGL
jgi:hypothetical protein